MKALLKWILITLGVVLLLLITLPILFKDKIMKAFDTALQQNIRAKVFYNTEQFSLGIFKNFPNLTLSVGQFGISGIDEFAGDTLLSVGRFDLVLDVGSVIFGNSIQIEKVGFDDLHLHAKVLKSGKANFDIMMADTTQKPEEAPAEATKFSVKIRSWYLNNAHISYLDRKDKIDLRISGLNHKGKGDFTQDVFDLNTNTLIQSISFKKDSVQYLANKKLEAILDINCNLPESKYTFGKNKIQINDFALQFEGMVQSLASGAMQLDVKCSTLDTEFKSLLSLVPGIYTDAFKDIKADGKFSFKAVAKGLYDSTQIPDYEVGLLVEKASFKYPSLPKSVDDIFIDFQAKGSGGVLENSEFDLKNAKLRIGNNPIEAKARIKGLKAMDVMAVLNAKVNLEEIMAAVPMPDLTVKGMLSANISADGRLDMDKNLLPKLQAKFDWDNGFVQSAAFPKPIENIQMHLNAINESNNAADMLVQLQQFQFTLDGEPFALSANVKKFDNPQFEAKAKGIIDLEKMTKIFPQPGMKLAGKIKADIATAGQKSDIDAGRYEKIPTSGSMELQNFYFSSTDYPQGIKFQSGNMTFNPKEIKITNLKGALGKSDIAAEGYVSNYMAYLFKNETIKGNFNFSSTNFDCNEWLPTDDAPQTAQSTAADTEPVQVPTNLDVQLKADIAKLLYDNMVMTDFKGTITVRNGEVVMDPLRFDMLGGSVATKGKFSTQNPEKPQYSFELDLKNMSVSEAYKTFNTIQALAPVAQKLDGRFSTKFSISGNMDKALSPDLSTISGQGMVNLVQGMLKDFTLAKGINGLTKSNIPSDVALKDILVKARIDNGKLYFEPFTIQMGNIPFTIGGSNALDGSVDYLVKTSLPGGPAGAAAAAALSKFTGSAIGAPERINVDIKVGGTFSSPKYTIAKVDAGGTGSQAKQAAQQQINQAKAEAEAKARAEAERLQREAQERAEAARREAEQKAKEEAEKAQNQAKDKANEELKKLKDRFKRP